MSTHGESVLRLPHSHARDLTAFGPDVANNNSHPGPLSEKDKGPKRRNTVSSFVPQVCSCFFFLILNQLVIIKIMQTRWVYKGTVSN